MEWLVSLEWIFVEGLLGVIVTVSERSRDLSLGCVEVEASMEGD